MEEEGRAFVLANDSDATHNEVKRRCKQVWEGLEASTKFMDMKTQRTARAKWRDDKQNGVVRG